MQVRSSRKRREILHLHFAGRSFSADTPMLFNLSPSLYEFRVLEMTMDSDQCFLSLSLGRYSLWHILRSAPSGRRHTIRVDSKR